MTELIVGKKYNHPYVNGEILIIAHSPTTGNYIGQSDDGNLTKYTSDGRTIHGMKLGTTKLIPIQEEIEVEYEFWVNFYKDGTTGTTYSKMETAINFASKDIIETKKFTHKAKYTE